MKIQTIHDMRKVMLENFTGDPDESEQLLELARLELEYQVARAGCCVGRIPFLEAESRN